MTDDYDPYDDNAHREEARALAAQDAAQHLLRLHNDRRPAAFNKPGDLDPRVAAWVDGYLAGERGSLVLVGNIGTGKTWSLWKAAEILARAGWRGRFEITAAYDVKAATDRPINTALIEQWKRADLFAIDDLGAHGLNDWDVDALAALIDHRWQHQRPTVVASNETDLKPFVGARAASRLVDGATIVRFTGADRRRAS